MWQPRMTRLSVKHDVDLTSLCPFRVRKLTLRQMWRKNLKEPSRQEMVPRLKVSLFSEVFCSRMLLYLLTQVVALLSPLPSWRGGGCHRDNIMVVLKRETYSRRQSGKIALGYTQECHFRLRRFTL